MISIKTKKLYHKGFKNFLPDCLTCSGKKVLMSTLSSPTLILKSFKVFPKWYFNVSHVDKAQTGKFQVSSAAVWLLGVFSLNIPMPSEFFFFSSPPSPACPPDCSVSLLYKMLKASGNRKYCNTWNHGHKLKVKYFYSFCIIMTASCKTGKHALFAHVAHSSLTLMLSS